MKIVRTLFVMIGFSHSTFFYLSNKIFLFLDLIINFIHKQPVTQRRGNKLFVNENSLRRIPECRMLHARRCGIVTGQRWTIRASWGLARDLEKRECL